MLSKKQRTLHNRAAGSRIVFFILLAALFCLPVYAQQPKESVNSAANSDKSAIKAPFELYGNHILVAVRINNLLPFRFYLDSGAGVNLINTRTAEKLGLKSRGSVNIAANGGTGSGSFIENATVELGGVKAADQLVVSAPLEDLNEYAGRDVSGIIGNNFIKNFVVEIDYANQTLIFHDPKNYNLAAEPDAVALKMRRGTPFVKAELSLDGKTVITDSFPIDTGSGGILSLNKPFAEKHRVLQIVPKTSVSEGAGGAGLGGELRKTDVRISSIKIGKYTLDQPVIGILEDKNGKSASPYIGLIGTDLLRRFTVVLDYQSERMLLEPNADYKEPFEIDLSGLQLVAKGGDLKTIVIKQVRAGFPAAVSGLREGDILVSVDSRSIDEFDLDKLSKMFRQNGSEYQLTVKRGSELINVKLTLKKII